MPPWAIPITTSKARSCPRTSTFVHRSDDRTTTARADFLEPRRYIVVWPAHLVSQRITAWQSRRPKRLMAVCSFAHCEAALSPQAAYSDYEIGAFENFHQPVEDTLIILRPGPKVIFQYELRFVNRMKSQLLISHLFLPIKSSYPSNKCRPKNKKKQEIKLLLGNIPTFLSYPINFYFNARSPQRTIARLPSSTPLSKSTDWILSAVAATLCAFLAAAAKIAAVFSKSIHGAWLP